MYDSDRTDLVDDATLRRSQRERRFIYANFTPSEIHKTIHKKHTIDILNSSEVSHTIFLLQVIELL